MSRLGQRRRSRTTAVQDLRNAIREAVDSGRMSVADIALKSGISRMQVYRILDDENKPALDKAEEIAKALGMVLRLVPAEPAK